MPPLSPEKPALCAGCGGKISDRYYLLAVDKQWHLRCLKCCECKLALESELTCFAKDGSIYCKEDYYRYSHPAPQSHTPLTQYTWLEPPAGNPESPLYDARFVLFVCFVLLFVFCFVLPVQGTVISEMGEILYICLPESCVHAMGEDGQEGSQAAESFMRVTSSSQLHNSAEKSGRRASGQVSGKQDFCPVGPP